MEEYWRNHSLEDIEGEEWRDIDISPFEGLYQISNMGRVKALKKRRTRYRRGVENGYWQNEKIIKTGKIKAGYIMFILCCDTLRKNIKVARLVGKYFIPNPDNLPFINHKNGIKWDNRVENLEWCTQSENVSHSYRIGLQKALVGENNPNAHIKDIDAWNIYNEIGTNINIAKKYGCLDDTVYKIKNNLLWQSVIAEFKVKQNISY